MAEGGGDQRVVARTLRGFAQGHERLGRLAGFEQNLPLDLEEIRIGGLGLHKCVGFGVGFVGVASFVIRVGAGVVGVDRLVAGRVGLQRLVGGHDVAGELRLHAAEAFLQRGVGLVGPGGRRLEVGGERRDALARERMRLHERIDVGGAEAVFLLLQFLEEAEHAAAGDVRLAEEFRAGRVGGRFLDAAEREVAAHRRLLARRHDAGAGLAAAGRHRGEAEHHRE